jgi:signal peptidase II
MSAPDHGRRQAISDAIDRRLRREAGYRFQLMLVIALGVVVLDQATKAIVRSAIPVGDTVDVLPGVHLVDTVNTGIAFSLFPGNQGAVAAVTLVAIAAIAVLLVGFAGRHALVPIGGGLLLGGSIGNLIDRVWREGVTDFIAIGPWPPFNVADIGVTLGAILLVLALIFSGGDD